MRIYLWIYDNIEKKPQNNIKVIIIKNNSNYYVNNINKKNSSQDRVIKTNYIKGNKKFINLLKFIYNNIKILIL